MRITKIFTLTGMAILLAACENQKDQFNQPESSQQPEALTPLELKALDCMYNGTDISQEEATKSAESLMRFLDSGELTKAAQSRTIKSVEPILAKGKGTKAGEQTDTMAYVFNFSNESGYAILSSDRRTSSVLALVPEGNIDFESDNFESYSNTGVMVFYGNLYGAIKNQIDDIEQNRDSLINSALAKMEQAQDGPGTKGLRLKIRREGPFYDYVIPPLLPMRWGQLSPYNYSAPIDPDELRHCVNGCVAVAVSQVMAYWRCPAMWNYDLMMPEDGYYDLKNYYKISDFIRWVGAGVHTKYGLTSSSAYFEDIPAFLLENGYTYGEKGEYEAKKVRNSFYSHRPVIICGSMYKCEVYESFLIFWEKYSHTYYSQNHTWVLDGLMSIEDPVVIYWDDEELTRLETLTNLVHCNFGWPGSNINGWYLWDCFDINNGLKHQDSHEAETKGGHTDISGQDGLFQFNLECLYDIHPVE